MKFATRAATACLAFAALAGCSHSPSTAAVVGDVVIPEARLTETVESCKAAGLEITRTRTLFFLVIGDIADHVAQGVGTPFDEAGIQQSIESDPQGRALVGTPCEKVLHGHAKLSLMQRNMNPVTVQQMLPQVELNPRYGSWDPEQGLDPQGGSISVATGADDHGR